MDAREEEQHRADQLAGWHAQAQPAADVEETDADDGADHEGIDASESTFALAGVSSGGVPSPRHA